jgi:hypothetical protein
MGAPLVSRAVGAALAGVVLAPVAGCEWVTGISDKTLVSTGVPCSKQAPYVFCDDFDSEPSFGASWDWHSAQSGGAFDFDSTDYASAPRSGRFTCPVTSVSSAQLGRQGDQLPGGLRLAFDLRLDVDGFAGLAQTSVAQVLTATSGMSINYVLGPGSQASLQIFGNGGAATNVNLAVPPLRQWTHIEMSTDWKTISVSEDGKTLGSTKLPGAGPPGGISLIVGIVYANPLPGGPPVTLELDDVALFGS